MKDLIKVYQALTLQEAELAFEQFKEKWGNKYPIIIRSWEKNWDELTAYFKYPYELRRIIYTTYTDKKTMPIFLGYPVFMKVHRKISA